MAKLAPQIAQAAALIGHKSLSVHVYSHPKAGIGASLSWGVWEESRSVAVTPQVSYSRDSSLRDWRDALDVVEQLVMAARHQLELCGESDE